MDAKYYFGEQNKLIDKATADLDACMSNLDKALVKSSELSDSELQSFLLDLTSILYFAQTQTEVLGVYRDAAKQEHKKLTAQVKLETVGTVAHKESCATVSTYNAAQTVDLYDGAYNVCKVKCDGAMEMVNTLKKVINIRIGQMELSRGNRN